MALSTLLNSDNIPIVVLNLKDDYPSMEPQGVIPEVLKKVTAYEVVSIFIANLYPHQFTG